MGNANLRKSGLELRSKCNDFNTAWKGAQQIEIFFLLSYWVCRLLTAGKVQFLQLHNDCIIV